MMFGHPFFDDESDYGFYHHADPFGGRRRSAMMQQQQQQRRAAQEEARRRAELERYYRLKELEEQEKIRQRQEYMRQLRLQQQREREEEERLRQRRQLQEQARMRQFLGLPHDHSYERESDSSSEDENIPPQSDYVIVRGTDGRLYRVPRSYVEKSPQQPHRRSNRSSRQPSLSTADHHEENHMETDSSNSDEDSTYEQKIRQSKPKVTQKTKTVPISFGRKNSSSVDVSVNVDQDGEHASVPTSQPTLQRRKSYLKPKKQRKKKITVIVEDASDSENEDEFKSVWRNRRPSPGQWMEPIE